MSKIPGGSQVKKALKAVRKALKASLKDLNQQAGKQMARGNYVGAEVLVDLARSVDAFDKEVKALTLRWKDVRGADSGGGSERTPMWEYYQPILRALQALGGRATFDDLLTQVQREMDGRLRDADLKATPKGPRWQAVVRKARKHMVQQGFLEASKGAEWRITQAGRAASREKPGEA